MTEPDVSIIVPVYNAGDGQRLHRTLDSALGQEGVTMEVIAVDDASTDSTADRLEARAVGDPRLRVLRQSVNQGQGAARNRGMDAAQGRYLFHLDADDALLPGALATLLEAADRDAADITFGQIRQVDQRTGRPLPYRNDQQYVVVPVRRTRLRDFPRLVYAHNTLNRLYRRSFWQASGVRFETDPRYAEDVLFSLRTNLAAEAISIVPQPTYVYRTGNYLGAATVQKVLDARENMIRALQIVRATEDPFLVREMERKQALEAAKLERPERVFDRDALLDYLPTLRPLVADTPEAVIAGLPRYPRRFAEALRAGEYAKALALWEERAPTRLPKGLDHPWVHRVAPRLPPWVKAPAKRVFRRFRRR